MLPVKTLLFMCVCLHVYVCVAGICQWPIKGKIETPLGTDSLNQHNLLGFTIRPGDSFIARWQLSPEPQPKRTADYLLSLHQLQPAPCTPTFIYTSPSHTDKHTHFSDRFPCYFSYIGSYSQVAVLNRSKKGNMTEKHQLFIWREPAMDVYDSFIMLQK